ncbi:MAG: trans-aconitate 2-methyltransferase [Polyangiaceae bacterium]|nr:trans-aconitate 2-methyltransferase [Polyangiaceae bacterium]
MAPWDPVRYTKFEAERTQPARDLLARVDVEAPGLVVDLGCGPGNSTALLSARWPHARVEGIDSDEAMLAEARRRNPDGIWIQGDVAAFSPDRPCDVVFSNATLHWLTEHERLFPRLLAHVRQGGVLAVQMPRNYGAPSHRSIAEVAADGPWAGRLAERARIVPVGDAAFYYDVLAPRATRVDVWETEYVHVMPDAGAIVDWVEGTGLRPFIDALTEGERPLFRARYRAEIARLYPARPDGNVLFSFRRIFVVATR